VRRAFAVFKRKEREKREKEEKKRRKRGEKEHVLFLNYQKWGCPPDGYILQDFRREMLNSR